MDTKAAQDRRTGLGIFIAVIILVALFSSMIFVSGQANANVADGTIPAGFGDDTSGKDPVGWDWDVSGQAVIIYIYLDDGWAGEITAIEVFLDPEAGDSPDVVKRLSGDGFFLTGQVLSFIFSTTKVLDRDLPTPVGLHLMGLGPFSSGYGYELGDEEQLLTTDGPTNLDLLTPAPGPTPTPGPTATPVTITEVPIGEITVVALPENGSINVIQPSVSNSLNSPDGSLVVTIPAISHPTTFQLAYNPSPAIVPETPANMTLINAFELNAHDTDGVGISLRLLKTITLTVKYTDADASAAPQGSAANLKIITYSDITSSWSTLHTVVDIVNKTLTAGTRHLSLFAIVGVEPVSQGAVGTTTPEPPVTGDFAPSSGLLFGIILLGFLMIAAGGAYMAESRRARGPVS